MQFPIVIHQDKDSDYGVIVPDLPGCFSAGNSYEEALKSAKEAILCHIEGLLIDGETIPAIKRVDEHIANSEYENGIWAFVDLDLTEIAGKAVRINITLPDKILTLVDLYVKNHDEKNRSAFLTNAVLNYIAASECANQDSDIEDRAG